MSTDSYILSAEDQHLLDRVAASGDRLVTRAVAWAEVNSGSRNLEGLDQVARQLVAELSGLPGRVEEIALEPLEEVTAQGEVVMVPQGRSLRLTVRPEAPRQVVLTGHYDTVFGADSTFRSVEPLPDGSLRGPGLADMKGGISVMLGALEAFEAHPLSAELGYTVLLSPDEEVGSLASAPLLAQLAQRAKIALTYEPALPDGTLVSARKGSGNFHVVVRGRAAHAGRDFASGRNAVAAAARIAVALDGLNGLREGVTVNVARIDGGGPLNAVADRAVVRVNVRIPDHDAASWVVERVEEAVASGAADGIALSLHGAISRPPKPFDARQQHLFEQVRRIGEAIGQSIRWAPSGGVCEGNNLHAHGVASIDTLGVRGGAIHSDREFAWPESFVERAQLSALLLAKLAAGELGST